MKRIILILASLFLLTSCSQGADLATREKYESTFFGTFDTIVSYTAYEEGEEDFEEDAKFVEEEFQRLHKLYDNYNTYEGINNIKTLNDMAGQGPVALDEDLINLLVYSKENYENISQKVDISMGAVLNIWHDYREAGIENPENASLPPMEDLEAADEHTNMDAIVIDEENGTAEILDEGLEINLGATAKGYATELVCQALEERGVDSAILSAGGNVKTIGSPGQDRDSWAIGIQNPENALGKSDQQLRAVLYVNNQSIVTSGDYQRYYVVDGEMYHHIIDPDTLMPADYYSGVSVMTEDSGLADFLSTAAFLLPLEESRALVEEAGAEALWIMPDNSLEYTDGMEEVMEVIE